MKDIKQILVALHHHIKAMTDQVATQGISVLKYKETIKSSKSVNELFECESNPSRRRHSMKEVSVQRCSKRFGYSKEKLKGWDNSYCNYSAPRY